AGAERVFARPVDDVDLDRRNVGEAQDGVGPPIATGDGVRREAHFLEQRPAGRLDDGALDLVADAVGVDRHAAVAGGDGADRSDAAGRAVYLHFHRHRAVSREVLVLGEAEAAAAALREVGRARPAELVRGELHHVDRARIGEVVEAEGDRIDLRRQRLL